MAAICPQSRAQKRLWRRNGSNLLLSTRPGFQLCHLRQPAHQRVKDPREESADLYIKMVRPKGAGHPDLGSNQAPLLTKLDSAKARSTGESWALARLNSRDAAQADGSGYSFRRYTTPSRQHPNPGCHPKAPLGNKPVPSTCDRICGHKTPSARVEESWCWRLFRAHRN